MGAYEEIFGSQAADKPLDKLISQFDWKKVNVQDTTSKDYLTCDLIPSLRGRMTNEGMKAMDEQLKVAIAGTMKLLRNTADRSWDNLHAVLMQNPLITVDADQVARTQTFSKTGTNVFKFDGSADSAIVNEVTTWFKNLIADQDVLDSCKLEEVNVMSNIVAETGATVDSFVTFFHKKEQHYKNLVDIGVLRFPDIAHPYFKVYRIKLAAWSKSERVLMVQQDNNGITGDFNVRIYRPRKEVIDAISPQVKAMAVKQAESLFD